MFEVVPLPCPPEESVGVVVVLQFVESVAKGLPQLDMEGSV